MFSIKWEYEFDEIENEYELSLFIKNYSRTLNSFETVKTLYVNRNTLDLSTNINGFATVKIKLFFY